MATQKEDRKLVLKTNYRLMQVKSIVEWHSAILLTFLKLLFLIKIFVLSIFEWPLKTDLTVLFVVLPNCKSQRIDLKVGSGNITFTLQTNP